MIDFVFVEREPVTGRVVPAQPGTTIGREGCDVLLPDPEVSRRHAVIRFVGGAPALEDLGSTNGTWINERRVDGPTPIKLGDTIRFGNTVWQVQAAGAATRVSARRPF